MLCKRCMTQPCSCVRSTQDRIEALELALTETWWNEREIREIKQELEGLKNDRRN